MEVVSEAVGVSDASREIRYEFSDSDSNVEPSAPKSHMYRLEPALDALVTQRHHDSTDGTRTAVRTLTPPGTHVDDYVPYNAGDGEYDTAHRPAEVVPSPRHSSPLEDALQSERDVPRGSGGGRDPRQHASVNRGRPPPTAVRSRQQNSTMSSLRARPSSPSAAGPAHPSQSAAEDDESHLRELQVDLDQMMRTVLIDLRRVTLAQTSPKSTDIDDPGTVNEHLASPEQAISMLSSLEASEDRLAQRTSEFVEQSCVLALRRLNAKQPTTALRLLLRAEAMTQQGAGKTFRYIPEASEARAVTEEDGRGALCTEEACWPREAPTVAMMASSELLHTSRSAPDANVALDSLGAIPLSSSGATAAWEVKLPFYAASLEPVRLKARAVVLNNRGLYHYQMGEYDMAKQFLIEAVALEETLCVPTIGITYFNVAQVSWEQANERHAASQRRSVDPGALTVSTKTTSATSRTNEETNRRASRHHSRAGLGRAHEAVVAAHRAEAFEHVSQAARATEQEVHRHQATIERLKHALTLLQEEVAVTGPSPHETSTPVDPGCVADMYNQLDTQNARAVDADRLHQEVQATMREVAVNWTRWRDAIGLLAHILAQHARWLRELKQQPNVALHLYEQSIRWLSVVPKPTCEEHRRLERLRAVLARCRQEIRSGQWTGSAGGQPNAPAYGATRGRSSSRPQKMVPPTTAGTSSTSIASTPTAAAPTKHNTERTPGRQGVSMLRSLARTRYARQQAIHHPHHHIVTTMLPSHIEVTDPVVAVLAATPPTPLSRANSMPSGRPNSVTAGLSAAVPTHRSGTAAGAGSTATASASSLASSSRPQPFSPYMPKARSTSHASRRRAGPRARVTPASRAAPPSPPPSSSLAIGTEPGTLTSAVDVAWHSQGPCASCGGTAPSREGGLSYPYYFNPPSYQRRHTRARAGCAAPATVEKHAAQRPRTHPTVHAAYSADPQPASDTATNTPAAAAPYARYYYYWCDSCAEWHYCETEALQHVENDRRSERKDCDAHAPEEADRRRRQEPARHTAASPTEKTATAPAAEASKDSPSHGASKTIVMAPNTLSSSSHSASRVAETPPAELMATHTAESLSPCGQTKDSREPPRADEPRAANATQDVTMQSSEHNQSGAQPELASSAGADTHASAAPKPTAATATTAVSVTDSVAALYTPTRSSATPASFPSAPAIPHVGSSPLHDVGFLSELIRRLVAEETARRALPLPHPSRGDAAESPSTVTPPESLWPPSESAALATLLSASRLADVHGDSNRSRTPSRYREPSPPPPLSMTELGEHVRPTSSVLDHTAHESAATTSRQVDQTEDEKPGVSHLTDETEHCVVSKEEVTDRQDQLSDRTSTAPQLPPPPSSEDAHASPLSSTAAHARWSSRRGSSATAPVSFCEDEDDDDHGSASKAKNTWTSAHALLLSRSFIHASERRLCASMNTTPMKRLPAPRLVDAVAPAVPTAEENSEEREEGDDAVPSWNQSPCSAIERSPDASAVRDESVLDDDAEDATQRKTLLGPPTPPLFDGEEEEPASHESNHRDRQVPGDAPRGTTVLTQRTDTSERSHAPASSPLNEVRTAPKGEAPRSAMADVTAPDAPLLNESAQQEGGPTGTDLTLTAERNSSTCAPDPSRHSAPPPAARSDPAYDWLAQAHAHTPVRTNGKTIESEVGTPYTLSSQASPTQEHGDAQTVSTPITTATATSSAVASPDKNRLAASATDPSAPVARRTHLLVPPLASPSEVKETNPAQISAAVRSLLSETPPSPLYPQDRTATMLNSLTPDATTHTDATGSQMASRLGAAHTTALTDSSGHGDVDSGEAPRAEPGPPSVATTTPSERPISQRKLSLSSSSSNAVPRVFVYSSGKSLQNRAKLRQYLSRDRRENTGPGSTRSGATNAAPDAYAMVAPAVKTTHSAMVPAMKPLAGTRPPSPCDSALHVSSLGGRRQASTLSSRTVRTSSTAHLTADEHGMVGSSPNGTFLAAALAQTRSDVLSEVPTTPSDRSVTRVLPRTMTMTAVSQPIVTPASNDGQPHTSVPTTMAPTAVIEESAESPMSWAASAPTSNTNAGLAAALEEQQRWQAHLTAREQILREEAAALIQATYAEWRARCARSAEA